MLFALIVFAFFAAACRSNRTDGNGNSDSLNTVVTDPIDSTDYAASVTTDSIDINKSVKKDSI